MMANTDVFNVAAQSKFMSSFGADFSKNIKRAAMDNDRNALNPMNAIDNLVVSLESTGASADYVEAVRELKTDPDLLKALDHFDKSLKGEANMLEMKKVVHPDSPEGNSKAGLYEKIVKEEVDDESESELVRYTNYITEYSGYMTDTPGTLHDIADLSLGLYLRDYNKWQEKLDGAQEDIDKINAEEIDFEKKYGDNPRRIIDKSKTADMQDGATKRSLADVEAKRLVGRKKIAVAQHELYSKKLMDVSTKKAGSIRAKSMIGKVTNKMGVVTSGIGTVTGGLGIAVGDQMLAEAKTKLENGDIDKDEYNKIRREAQMKITEGAFGIGSGVNDLGTLLAEKVGKKVSQKLASRGFSVSKSATRMLSRFGTVVGGALSIGMGAMAMANNVMAADEARKEKNYGRMAMYGIMAALDAVSIILDVVSTVLDFIPGIGQAISLIVDLVNTIVGLVNMVIGFFADMVDTRTDEDKVKQAFDEYVESSAFKDYINRQAEVYKNQGYDLFQFIIDAKAADISEGDFDSTKVDKTIIKKLSDKAVEDSSNRQLRIALVDASSIGRELRGRAGDDLIMAGVGADTLYGEEGDDLLYGEEGNNTLYGGPGNDYLNGGTGRNQLFGGAGDDWMVVKPGIDTLVDGGPGSDTVEVSAEFFSWYKYGAENTIKLGFGANHIQGCYIDLSHQKSNQNGRAGLALGALISDISALDGPNSIHKKAFTSDSSLESDLRRLFWADAYKLDPKKLSGNMLWFLAHDTTSHPSTDLKYVTDGISLYAHGKKEGWTGTWKSQFSIANIPSGIAQYDESNMALTYNPGKQLEALFLFAFRGTKCVQNVEKIVESQKEIDIQLQVIGDDKTNLIDILYGYNEYVYTGNGDNVVIMSSSFSPPWEMWKYIVGGDGDNTLIINSSSRSRVPRGPYYAEFDVGGLFMLLEADINLANANRLNNGVNSDAWPRNRENKVDRGIYLKNIKRIQLNAQMMHNANYHVDATNLSNGHTFIVDSDVETFRLVGTPGDDTIFIKNIARKSSMIDGFGGTNLLNFENYRGNDLLTVSLEDGFRSGSIRGRTIWTTLKNIQSVKGSHMVTAIEGSHRDNLLIASGGRTMVNGKGGRNTLVSARGCHTFEGSNNGINTYIISGPDIYEIMTITVTNVHKSGLRASSLYGVWSNGLLTVDLLKNEPAEIRLLHASVVDASGITINNKGWVSVQDNKVLFRIQHYFSNLEDGASETVRVKFVTRGSTATINEPGDACVLRFKAFARPDDFNIIVNSNNDLEFQTLNGETIFVDKYWGNCFRSGNRNPISLISSFGRRFQMIVFELSGTALDYKGIFSMLQQKLGSWLTDATNDYDHITDLARMTQSNMVQFVLGEGDNQTLLSVRNIKLVLGDGTNLVDGSGTVKRSASNRGGTSIVLGNGKTTVLLGTGREPITIENFSSGTLSLIFKNINLNSLAVQQSYGPAYSLTYNGSLVAIVRYITPTNMAFLHNGVMALIDDIPKYIQSPRTYYHRLELADGKRQLRLRIAKNVSSSDVTFLATAMDKGIRLSFMANGELVYEFMANTTEMDMEYLSLLTRYQLRGGVVMSDGIKVGQALEDFVKNQLVPPGTAPGIQENIIYVSKRQAGQLTLASADDIVVADRSGSVVHTEGGNDFIRVSAPNVTVRTGEGKDIVFVQSGMQGVRVEFKAPDNSYVSGRNVLVLEGVTGNSVSLSYANDGRLSSQPYENTNVPIKIKNGANLYVQVDKAPSCLMFKNGDEYEVIKFSRVPSYFSDQPYNRYTARNFINAEGKMYLKATDVKSSDLQVSISTYSTSWLRIHTPSVFSIYQFSFSSGGSSTVSASDLTLQVAAEFPGGIQFQDTTKQGGQFLVYLLGKMASASTSSLVITGATWSESQATSAFNTYLASNNPNSDYTTVVTNVARSLSY